MKQIFLTLSAILLLVSPVMADDTKSDQQQYQWPMTQRYEHNPLFVAFPSPGYQSNRMGALYTADPSAHVWKIDGEDVLYVYPSHDLTPPKGCDRMDRYHVFSTKNLLDWTDHGEILNASQVPWGRPSGGFMWAPDAAYKNGKYYFYFPHPSDEYWDTSWKVGVAVSDYPDRDFTVQGYIPDLGDARAMIDPCVFVDDDGQAYFYYGGGGRLVGGKLKDNMMEIDGELTEFCNRTNKALGDFHEAAWVFKRNGIYYLTYSDNHPTNLGGNHLVYSTGPTPLGPWTYQGIYMYPHGFDTAHGSVVKYKGKWYAFYHTGNYGNRGNQRSVCFDELTFTKDGKINVVNTWGKPYGGKLPVVKPGKVLTIEAEHYNDGGSHRAYYKRPTTARFELGNPHTDSLQTDTEGTTTYLKGMRAAEWVRYSFRAKKSGRYTLRVRMRQTRNPKVAFRLGINGCWQGGTENLAWTTPRGEWGYAEVKDVELQAGENVLEWRGYAGTADIDAIEISTSKL